MCVFADFSHRRLQDDVGGGIADRPENSADVFHLFFGVCGLSLLQSPVGVDLQLVDAAYALPVATLQHHRIGPYREQATATTTTTATTTKLKTNADASGQ